CPDQAVRRRAADEERAREQPEVPVADAEPEPVDRGTERTLRPRRRRRVLLGAVRLEADRLRPVANHERDDRQDDRDGDGGNRERRGAPTVRRREPGERGKEDELAARVARREQPGDEAAALVEPAVRDGGRE